MKQNGKSGEHLTTNPSCGYMKDPENLRKHGIVGPEATAVVRKIFEYTVQVAKKPRADFPLHTG